MPIIIASEMDLITDVNNLPDPHKDATLHALEEATIEMAKSYEKTFEISLIFAKNNEGFNEAFSKLAKLHGYEIQQNGRKFFLTIPRKD